MHTNGRVIDEDNEPRKPRLAPRPTPSHVCVRCHAAVPMVEHLCEACFTLTRVKEIEADLTRAYSRAARLNDHLIHAKRDLAAARDFHSDAVKRGHRCIKGCGESFGFWGDLKAHEEVCKFRKPTAGVAKSGTVRTRTEETY